MLRTHFLIKKNSYIRLNVFCLISALKVCSRVVSTAKGLGPILENSLHFLSQNGFCCSRSILGWEISGVFWTPSGGGWLSTYTGLENLPKMWNFRRFSDLGKSGNSERLLKNNQISCSCSCQRIFGVNSSLLE